MNAPTQTAVATETAAATLPAVETLPAVRRPQLVAGGRVQAIVPRTIEETFRLAGAIAAADMAPKSYKRNTEAIMVGIMHGMEVGFTPMAALQSIAVINGMPAIWGDGALALIEASGLLEDKKEWWEGEGIEMVFYCEMKRLNRPTWIKQKFSWADAVKAKLTGKDTYQQYDRRMLQRRARAWAMTDGFADVLRGLHIRETIDITPNDDDEDSKPAKPTRQSVLTAQPVPDDEAEAADRAMDQQYAATMSGRMPDDPEPEVDAGEVEPEVDESEPTPDEMGHDFPTIRKEIEGKLLKAGKPDAIDAIVTAYAVPLAAMKKQAPDMARELSATFAARRTKLQA